MEARDANVISTLSTAGWGSSFFKQDKKQQRNVTVVEIIAELIFDNAHKNPNSMNERSVLLRL